MDNIEDETTGAERSADYTARLETLLAASEARYRELFDEEAAGRFLMTRDGRVFDANDGLAQMLGLTDVDAAIGRSLADFVDDRAALTAVIDAASGGTPVNRAEISLTRIDGDPLHVLLWLTPLGADTGGVVSIRGRLVDVTAFERLKTRMVGARRMEALGKLTGGAAHEFNNLLSIIDGHLERIEGTPAAGSIPAASIHAIRGAVERAASLTRQLLAFGRRQPFHWTEVALPDIVQGTRPSLVQLLGETVTLHVELGDAVPLIRADPAQLEQVLVNVATNAREAMPAGGSLTIRVDAIEIDATVTSGRAWLRQGPYVRMQAIDTGHGMDPLTKARAFEPFFTTKRVGDGAGLGLATVYGIVKQTGGYVWLESEPERGTALTLLFPVAHIGSRETTDAVNPDPRATILLIERDSAVRAMTADTLRGAGFAVIAVDSDAAAVDRLTGGPDRADLLIRDAELSESDASTRIGELVKGSTAVPILVSAKPFSQRALLDRVRQALASAGGTTRTARL